MHEIAEDIMDTREGGVPEGTMIPAEYGQPAPESQTAPPIVLDPERKLGRGPIIAAFLLVLVLGVFIVDGHPGRVHAEETLAKNTKQDSVLSVAVTTPSHGADALEITLPANTQAFIDTPIYARTNGYLRRWYADIGTACARADRCSPRSKRRNSTSRCSRRSRILRPRRQTSRSRRLPRNAGRSCWQRTPSPSRRPIRRRATSARASRRFLPRRPTCGACSNCRALRKIYAPFDGVITARNVDIGSLIQAGDSNSPRAELFHMASTDKLRLFVPVPEVYANRVHNGDRIAVTSDAAPNQKFIGTIVRNSDSIDISSRTLNVEVDVLNTDHKLLPGQYAFVHLPIPPSGASMTLPSNVLLFRAEGLRVGVVRDGRVQLVPVQIGHDYGATVEITAGLAPQDQVILNPSDSLAQGERVQVEKGDAE